MPEDKAVVTENVDAQQASDSQAAEQKASENLEKVLENKELWKLPRLKSLLDAEKNLKKLQKDKEVESEKALEEQKKFAELAEKRKAENELLQKQLQEFKVNQALTNKLMPLGVVDLDGALKLIDRSNIIIGDNGDVENIDNVVATFKEQKQYLFSDGKQSKTLGSPATATKQDSTIRKFTVKEIENPVFYKEHRDEILKAAQAGMIE